MIFQTSITILKVMICVFGFMLCTTLIVFFLESFSETANSFTDYDEFDKWHRRGNIGLYVFCVLGAIELLLAVVYVVSSAIAIAIAMAKLLNVNVGPVDFLGFVSFIAPFMAFSIAVFIISFVAEAATRNRG